MLPRRPYACALVALLGALLQPHPAHGMDAAVSPAAADDFFEKHVRPVLVQSCYSCHSASAKELKGGLRLDNRERVLKGGEGGKIIVPGKPGSSRLITAIKYQDPDLQMPPKGKLPDEQIAALTTWVRMGAAWPETKSGEIVAPLTGASIAGPVKAPFNLQQRKATHWAWQPLQAKPPPTVRHANWAQDPLDRFLLTRWEAAGLEPPQMAERRVLIRRAYFDLIGLPPKPAEIDAFASDASPQAWQEVVDRLLASPQFGERWARHWLDLARYADTRGHEFDYDIDNAWQYRDYVIRAFNAEVPYDQFVTEQIAGDLLNPPRLDPTGRINESVLGTGFWFLGEWIHSPVDIRLDELDRVDNEIDVMGKTFLGLTLGCARCHDHKFDAISSKDYYALAGFLESSSFRDVRFEWQAQNRAVAEQVAALDAAARPKILPELAHSLSPQIDHLADYLLAAREVLAAGAKEPAGEPKSLAAAAKRRKLDGATLARWVELIQQARDQHFDPLYPWAALSHEDLPADSRLVKNAAFRRIVSDWRHEASRDSAPLPPGASIVIDYSHPAPGAWLTDGLAFGDGPASAGQIVLDPAWVKTPPLSAIVLAAGCGHSRLIGPNLPGMLRTPEFTITAPVILLRMQGSADVFAVVDSHRMVRGPLHRHTQWHADAGPEWKWVSHDLADYVGQRAHLEFTPTEAPAPFAIAEVVQASSKMSGPSRVNPLVAACLTADPSLTLETLARDYERLFRETALDLGADHLTHRPDSVPRAALANWMLENLAAPTAAPTSKSAAGGQFLHLLSDYRKQRADLIRQIKPSATAMAMLDGNGVDDYVLLRGNWHTPGEPAPRRFLEAISGAAQPPIERGSGRLELARRLLDPSDPLPSRVMVNRVWQHLFGRGVVPSVDNLGVMGQQPTDPQLLDYLAAGFVHDGWSVKRLIRRIMLSSAYQMSSRESPDDHQRDPQNLLLHHRLWRRLEGEAIRDEMLSVSGRLDLQMYGSPVEVFLTPFMEGRGRPDSGPLDGAGRRSIYIRLRRNFLPPLMTAFDMPPPLGTVGDRGTSNVPAQALILLNDPLVAELSRAWARQILSDKQLAPRARIVRMYHEALARAPDETELAAALEFVRAQTAELGLKPGDRAHEEAAWADLGQVLFNLKEFIYIE